MFKFFSHLSNVVKFNQLDSSQKQIVFYSEGKNYWVHLKGLIKELLATTDCHICYVSSASDDPGLQLINKKLNSFLIDEGWVRNWWFENLQADLLVMTMPDIHQYQVKRSKFPVHYIYVQHSLVSKHMVYRKGAFDHYDSVFCSAPHHKEELRAIEAFYDLPKKALYEHGYSRLDSIIKNASNHSNAIQQKEKTHVLIAPSWGEVNVVEEVGYQIVENLLDNGFRVTLRPHPQTLKLSKTAVNQILKQFNGHQDFSFEGSVDGERSLHQSDIMISDWSGAALDYAFGLGKPVLFIDVPRKVNNEEYEKINVVPFEDSVRNKIGEVMPLEDIGDITNWVKKCLNKSSFDEYNPGIYNLGTSDQAGAKLIMGIWMITQEKSKSSSDV